MYDGDDGLLLQSERASGSRASGSPRKGGAGFRGGGRRGAFCGRTGSKFWYVALPGAARRSTSSNEVSRPN